MMKRWQNRMVGAKIVDSDQLLANERNPRIHPKAQQDALTDMLSGIGWLQDVIVNKRTSEEWGRDRGIETVLDGHLRVSLAISAGEQVPVKYVDLNPQEETLALAAFDAIASMAVYDNAALDALLRDVQTDSPALDKMLAELAEKQGLTYDAPEEFKAFDETIETEHCCPKCGYRWSGKLDVPIE